MQKPIEGLPVHSGRVFRWRDDTGTVEASELRGEQDGRVWSDAADVGFYVTSHVTGIKKLFVLDDIKKGPENDIVSWTYVSYPDPALTIKIWND